MKTKLAIGLLAGFLLAAGAYLARERLMDAAASFGLVSAVPKTEGRDAHQHGLPAGQAAREEDGPAEAPAVEILPDRQQLIGVRTITAGLRPLEKVIRTVGRVEYDETRVAAVSVKVEGWIERLPAASTGRFVRKGEPLAEIYSPELLATQQELLNSLRWLKGKAAEGETAALLREDAGRLYEAARQRLRLFDVDEKEIDEIERTGKARRTLTIASPVEGHVILKNALVGMRVTAGEKLFEIADLSRLWVLADIYEHELGLVKAGQQARISLGYLEGRETAALVEYVYPFLAGETRTAKVRFSLPNPGGGLKPQMYANVAIRIPLGRRLAVPAEAVIDTGVRKVVYVSQGEGRFEPREVTTGVAAEGLVEIREGLSAGEQVAAAANFLLDSEAKLKGITPLKRKQPSQEGERRL